MIFGIYAGSITGTETGLTSGKEDNPGLILKALNHLSAPSKLFLVRGYIQYFGESKPAFETPANPAQYAVAKRKLDLVICYRSAVYNESHWTQFIIGVINRYKNKLYSLQITEEPNLKTVFSGDGSFENIEKALFAGIIIAKREIKNQQLKIKVGFNATPSFNHADKFWKMIGSDDFKESRKSVDYVGLDFFPDVFRPVAADGEPNDLKQSVINVLKYFRNINFKTGNISPATPIHITENGWPTGPQRTYEKQAEVIEKVIKIILDVEYELNIDTYEIFGLRDADSLNPDIFYQFGLLDDNYIPKPAFKIYQQLIKNF